MDLCPPAERQRKIDPELAHLRNIFFERAASAGGDRRDESKLGGEIGFGETADWAA
jgi:hypothetical protein